MANMIRDLKGLYGCIMDSNGNFLTKMTGVYRNVKLSERRYEFLKGLINLVMTTRITSENTKNYIKSNGSSVRDFVNSYNLTVKEEEQLKASSVSQNVDYDRKKLLNFFPSDTITKVIFSYELNITEYEKMLNNARAKYGGNRKMLSNLALNISKTAVNDNLTEEKFKDLLITISPYTKHQIKYVSENLPIEYAGYLNYLVSAHKLDGEDLKRFKHLRALLEGYEFIEPEEIDSTEQQEDIEPDKNETTIEDKEQVKGEIRETVITKAGGLKSIRIQYDSTQLSKDGIEDEFDIDPENIDFGDITDADVE